MSPSQEKNSRLKKRMQGVVVSGKMQKTIVVEVTRFKKHPKYQKRYRVTKRYKVHTEENMYGVGDAVIIEETRPLSKEKRWRIIRALSEKSSVSEG